MRRRTDNGRVKKVYIRKKLIRALYALERNFTGIETWGWGKKVNELMQLGIEKYYEMQAIREGRAALYQGHRYEELKDALDEYRNIQLFFKEHPDKAEDYEIFRLKIKRAEERARERENKGYLQLTQSKLEGGQGVDR
jgi:hypothetical protein